MSKGSIFSKINADGKIAIVTTLLGIYWVIEGFRLEVWDRISPGPGFFPVLVGMLTILFSILLFKESRMKKNSNMKKEELKWLIKVPLMAFVIVFAMNYVGTIVALFVFFLLWFKLIEKFNWKKTLILSICIMLVIYLIFVRWLQVPFPKLFGLL